VLAHLLLYGSEEIVESKDREVALLPHVQNPEEVLQRLRFLLVLHGQDKVKVGLVVHLALVGETLLEDPLHKNGGEGACPVAQQLRLAQHPVVVRVQVQILAVHPPQLHCFKKVGTRTIFLHKKNGDTDPLLQMV
jgi:hypothetical protein